MNKPRWKRAKEPQPAATVDADAKRAAEISQYIGRELRAMFDGVVAEAVPEKFRALLEALEKKQSSH